MDRRTVPHCRQSHQARIEKVSRGIATSKQPGTVVDNSRGNNAADTTGRERERPRRIRQEANDWRNARQTALPCRTDTHQLASRIDPPSFNNRRLLPCCISSLRMHVALAINGNTVSLLRLKVPIHRNCFFPPSRSQRKGEGKGEGPQHTTTRRCTNRRSSSSSLFAFVCPRLSPGVGRFEGTRGNLRTHNALCCCFHSVVHPEQTTTCTHTLHTTTSTQLVVVVSVLLLSSCHSSWSLLSCHLFVLLPWCRHDVMLVSRSCVVVTQRT